MNISQNGLNLIKKWEGGPLLTAKRFGNEKYLSIGYGPVIDSYGKGHGNPRPISIIA